MEEENEHETEKEGRPKHHGFITGSVFHGGGRSAGHGRGIRQDGRLAQGAHGEA